MILNLGDNHRIRTSDGNNLVLEELHVTEDGREYTRVLGFYGSLDTALRAALTDSKVMISIENAEKYETWLKRIEDVIENTV